MLARLDERSFRKVAVLISRSVVTGPQLPDQTAAMIMMRRDTAFARVLQTVGNFAAAIDRFHCRRAQGTVAHCGDINDRSGAESLGTFTSST